MACRVQGTGECGKHSYRPVVQLVSEVTSRSGDNNLLVKGKGDGACYVPNVLQVK